MPGKLGPPGPGPRRPRDATRPPPMVISAPGHPHDVRGYTTRRTPWRRIRGDNEQVSEDARRPARARLSRALAFVRSAEPRTPLSRRAVLTDIAIAAVVLAVSLSVAKFGRWPGPVVPDPRTGVVNIMPGQVVSIGCLLYTSPSPRD